AVIAVGKGTPIAQRGREGGACSVDRHIEVQGAYGGVRRHTQRKAMAYAADRGALPAPAARAVRCPITPAKQAGYGCSADRPAVHQSVGTQVPASTRLV